jgi:outer membrane protein OmpA-like peptidoglycan-associated protein
VIRMRYPRSKLLSVLALGAALALGACASKQAAPADSGGAEPRAGAEVAPAAVEDRGAATSAAAARPQAPKTEPSSLESDVEGFWPSPESRVKSVAISAKLGNAALLRSWKIEIAPVGGAAALVSFAGTDRDPPAAVSWDGRAQDGKLAAEGRYEALLSASYAEDILPPVSIRSRAFALSVSPPEPILVADPARLEPSSSGIKAPVSFGIDARPALGRLDSWRLDIVGPDGKLFRSFEGPWTDPGAVTAAPPPVSWDGLSASGAPVQAGRRYSALLSVRDAYGHAASTQVALVVADLPYASERSSVEPWTSGFSPNGDKVMDGMDFSLGFGQRASVRSWRLEIAQAEKGIVRVFRGAAPDLPSSISWDGTSSSGAAAPEGRYFATLNVDYGSSFSPAVARSPVFILDLTPPELRLSYSPALFAPGPAGATPGSEGEGSTLAIGLEASSELARLADWSVEIIDPGERVFARFDGAWPPSGGLEPLSWDGIGSDGALVESAEVYGIVARVRDELGNSALAKGKVETDILVVRDGDRYRVDVASIVFKGYTDNYQDLPAEQAAQNRLTLDRLAAKFAKFPGYRIRLIGHAVMINWDDPNLGKPEQAKVLVPLSKSRAAAIAKALAARGIDAKRMSIEGVGASRQVVPDSDIVNRWKNRRVEFYLEK